MLINIRNKKYVKFIKTLNLKKKKSPKVDALRLFKKGYAKRSVVCFLQYKLTILLLTYLQF